MGSRTQWGVEWSKQAELPDGGEVVRLTDSAKAGGYACHMYLNVPTFTADGNRLIFISTRGTESAVSRFGENLFTLEMDSGRISQITFLEDARMLSGWFDPKTAWHYFWRADGRLCRANIETGQIEDICHEPARQKSMIGLTCDSKYAVYAASDDDPTRPGPPIFTLYKIDLASGQRTKILAAGFRISHVQCSPTDPDFVLYNWECMTPGRDPYVPVMQRMWWTNLAGTAGGPFGNQGPNEGRTHEFFTADGRFVGYHGALHEPSGPPTDEAITCYTFGWISTATGRDWRQLTFDGPSGHCQASDDGGLICCDQAGGGHVGLILDEDPPRYLPLFEHGSSMAGQRTHPHPHFRPGHRQIVFSTDRAQLGGKQGRSDVYLLTLPDRIG